MQKGRAMLKERIAVLVHGNVVTEKVGDFVCEVIECCVISILK
jgi:hypothetical protein